MTFNKVSIIGIGLIGGSIGMAVKDLGLSELVVGFSRKDSHLQKAIDKKAIDVGSTNLKTCINDADLVILATPIAVIIPTLKEICPSLKDGAIVVDVASIKQEIVEQADKIVTQNIHFVGTHPMAGSEHSGINAARKFLFDNAVWAFTPSKKTNLNALEKVKSYFQALDTHPLVIDPKTHDQVVATISHLPYFIACSLIKTISDEKKYQSQMKELAASGFRDTTRVAASPSNWGNDIAIFNKEAILESIKNFKEALSKIEKEIKNETEPNNLDKLLASIQKFREDMY